MTITIKNCANIRSKVQKTVQKKVYRRLIPSYEYGDPVFVKDEKYTRVSNL